jgi:aldehyde dehydrogenase (NAD+)
VVDMVCRHLSSTAIGPGIEDKDLGPLISRKQQQRVQSMVAGNVKGEILCGGEPPRDAELAGGAYFAPTVIDDVDPASLIAQEEVFGPVLTVNRFSDEAEAITLANGTQYGLLGAVWTTDLSRAHRLAAEIRAGQVYVNTYGAGGGVELPFGGFKKSGYGREKGYEALDTFTATKTVVVRL